MTALLEYFDLVLSFISQVKTHLLKGFPEILGNPLQYTLALCAHLYTMNASNCTYYNCVLFSEKDYAQARDHFLYASKPEEYGNMLVEFACKKGYPSEADLFIAQAVLQ